MSVQSPIAPAAQVPALAASATNSQRLATLVLVLAGIVLAKLDAGWTWIIPAALALLAGLMAAGIRPLRRNAERAIERLNHPGPREARWTVLAVGIATVLYLYLSRLWQEPRIVPTWHDEQMLLIQAQMLARGRLWMQSHELPEFFETFHIFVKPVYAPMHFPGTALMIVPGVWLGLPHYVMPLLIASAVAALLYLIVSEAIDRASGFLAVLWLWCAADYRFMALAVRSQIPSLLLGLATIAAWSRWRRAHDWRWAAVIGAASGWGAITRPVEALCFALPVGVLMAWSLRRSPLRSWVLTGALLVLAAAPWLGLQLVFNKGVTGQWLRTPHQAYVEQAFPGAVFGFSDRSADHAPASDLPQLHRYYDVFVRPHLREHTLDRAAQDWLTYRLPLIAATTMPAAALLVLVMAGLSRLREAASLALVSMMVLFLAVYAAFPFFIADYTVSILPPVIMLGLLGVRAVASMWPAWQRSVGIVLMVALAALLLGYMPELNRSRRDQDLTKPLMVVNYLTLPQKVQPPALVLFTYSATGLYPNPHHEPVYNIDVAWPDDAPIIRAHDLGAQRNQRIYDYYARISPERVVYLYDRSVGELVRLGTARELSQGAGRPATGSAIRLD